MWLAGLGTRQRAVLGLLSIVLLALAVTLGVIGLSGQHHAPQPRAVAADTPSSPPGSLTTVAAPTTPAVPKPAPTPIAAGYMHLSIPAIHVQSAAVVQLGLNADRTVEVPPLSAVQEAGWYKYSPLPGAIGPSVILGHIDSAVAGKGVFYELGALKPGDLISVQRPDHMVADFTVDSVAEYPKSSFPTDKIYGNTDAPDLRLITCGGRFDASEGSYVDNIVAFASLKSLHPG